MSTRKLLALALVLALIFGGIAFATDTYVASEAEVTTSTSSMPATIGAAVSGKSLHLLACTIASSTSAVVTFQDGSGGTSLASFYLRANEPYTIDERVLKRGPGTTAGTAMCFSSSVAGTVTCHARIGAR